MSGVKVKRHARLVGAAQQLDDGVKTRRGTRGETPKRVVYLTPEQKSSAYRGECPACHAPIIAMSEIAVNEPTTQEPSKGDLIRCESCGNYSKVQTVNGRRRLRLELVGHVQQ